MTLAKVVLSWAPSPDITVTAATAISAAIIAYSREVTAFELALNDAMVLQTVCMIFPQLLDGGVCLKPAFKSVTRDSGNRCSRRNPAQKILLTPTHSRQRVLCCSLCVLTWGLVGFGVWLLL